MTRVLYEPNAFHLRIEGHAMGRLCIHSEDFRSIMSDIFGIERFDNVQIGGTKHA